MGTASSSSSSIGGERPKGSSSYIDRNKHKFVCAQSSDNPTATNLNKALTDELEKLANAYKSTKDTWRAFGYQKVRKSRLASPNRGVCKYYKSTMDIL